jgi:hypothetical protein
MTEPHYVLSLDIGANSIGWAALACDETGEATGFLEPMPSALTLLTRALRTSLAPDKAKRNRVGPYVVQLE